VRSLARDATPPLGATRAEVISALGEPANVYGWWPHEAWEYSSGLTVSFRHGILEVVD
jgi:hypothetical protein